MKYECPKVQAVAKMFPVGSQTLVTKQKDEDFQCTQGERVQQTTDLLQKLFLEPVIKEDMNMLEEDKEKQETTSIKDKEATLRI